MRKTRPPRDDADDFDSGEFEVAFPATAVVAGFIWIAFGSLGVLNAVILLSELEGVAREGVPAGARPIVGGVVGLIAAVFILVGAQTIRGTARDTLGNGIGSLRSEEHTSELQSLRHLVCRLLLEKKKKA